MDIPEFKECLVILNQTKLPSAFDGKRPAILITDANEKILNAITAKHWLANFDVDKKADTMYRLSSRRNFSKKKV